jgi:hypothetical protein
LNCSRLALVEQHNNIVLEGSGCLCLHLLAF